MSAWANLTLQGRSVNSNKDKYRFCLTVFRNARPWPLVSWAWWILWSGVVTSHDLNSFQWMAGLFWMMMDYAPGTPCEKWCLRLASFAGIWIRPSQLLGLACLLLVLVQVPVHIFSTLYNSFPHFSTILYKLIIASSSIHPCRVMYGYMRNTLKSEILLNEGTKQHPISARDHKF